MSSLLRFYVVRRTIALLLGSAVAWVTLQLCSAPPAYFGEWPPVARQVLRELVQGTLAVGFVGWFYLLLKPLILGVCGWAWAARIAFGFSLIPGVVSGYDLISGIFGLTDVEAGGLTPVIKHWSRVAGLPVAVGMIPLGLLEFYERVRTKPFFRMIVHRGNTAEWAGPHVIARHTERLPQRPIKGGFFNDGFIGGKVLAVDGDGSLKMSVDKSPAHWAWIGGPGSGKNICSVPSLAGYRGSLIHVSNKPDACDLYFGARVDQVRLAAIERGMLREPMYADTRGTTQTTAWVPGGRGIVLDYADQSAWGSCYKHTLVSDVEVAKSNARMLALAIADGFFPELPGSNRDRWYVLAPRNLLAAAMLHFLSFHDDLRMHNIPYIVERCMGFDRMTGEAGPQVMKKLFDEMLKNNHPQVGAFIRTTIVQVMELGSKSYGTLKSEFHNNCASVYDSKYREQLIGTSDFSYRDIGHDGCPFTLMHILPRGDAGLRAAVPIFRAHVELAMQIQQTKLDRPAVPTALVVDEARQFLQGISCVTKAPMLLRDARIRMWQMYQSWTGPLKRSVNMGLPKWKPVR